MNIAELTKGLEKIIDNHGEKALSAHRKKQSQYESWVVPPSMSGSYFTSKNIFHEQIFFDTATYEQTVVEGNKRQLLTSIKELTNNWDGNGAIAPETIVFDNAISFISILPLSITSELKQDRITPTPYGTIVFDWERDSQLISVEIGETQLGFFSELNDNSNLSIENIPFNQNELPIELLSAFKKLYL